MMVVHHRHPSSRSCRETMMMRMLPVAVVLLHHVLTSSSVARVNVCDAWLVAPPVPSLSNVHRHRRINYFIRNGKTLPSLVLGAAKDDDDIINNNNKDYSDGDDREKERMDVIRSLQVSFYGATAPPENDMVFEDDASSSSPQQQQQEQHEEQKSQQQQQQQQQPQNSRTALVPDNTISNKCNNNNQNEKIDASSFSYNTNNYYYSPNNQTTYNPAHGTIENLSLFRVPWLEVVGRSNVLHVHQPVYTNMMEKILHMEPPWYLGGLLVNNDENDEIGKTSRSNSATGSRDQRHETLSTWDQCDQINLPNTGTTGTITNNEDDECSLEQVSNTMGTLLRIVDYRRMADGSLLLFIQALERFVVTHVRQSLPHGIATVQLIPDAEEVNALLVFNNKDDESDRRNATLTAIRESMERWHRYEFEDTELQIATSSSSTSSSSGDQILGAGGLSKIVPYAHYSRVCQVESLRQEQLEAVNDLVQRHDNTHQQTNNNGKKMVPPPPPMVHPQHLLDRGILHHPLVTDTTLLLDNGLDDDDNNNNANDELEYRLWLALDAHFKSTRASISPHLTNLLPRLSSLSLSSSSSTTTITGSATNKNTTTGSSSSGGGNDDDDDAMPKRRRRWPRGFVLEKIAQATISFLEPSNAASTPPGRHADYPARYRQKRLSYTAGIVLETSSLSSSSSEDGGDGTDDYSAAAAAILATRRALLACPSTSARLAYLIQRIEGDTGEFQ